MRNDHLQAQELTDPNQLQQLHPLQVYLDQSQNTQHNNFQMGDDFQPHNMSTQVTDDPTALPAGQRSQRYQTINPYLQGQMMAAYQGPSPNFTTNIDDMGNTLRQSTDNSQMTSTTQGINYTRSSQAPTSTTTQNPHMIRGYRTNPMLTPQRISPSRMSDQSNRLAQVPYLTREQPRMPQSAPRYISLQNQHFNHNESLNQPTQAYGVHGMHGYGQLSPEQVRLDQMNAMQQMTSNANQSLHPNYVPRQQRPNSNQNTYSMPITGQLPHMTQPNFRPLPRQRRPPVPRAASATMSPTVQNGMPPSSCYESSHTFEDKANRAATAALIYQQFPVTNIDQFSGHQTSLSNMPPQNMRNLSSHDKVNPTAENLRDVGPWDWTQQIQQTQLTSAQANDAPRSAKRAKGNVKEEQASSPSMPIQSPAAKTKRVRKSKAVAGYGNSQSNNVLNELGLSGPSRQTLGESQPSGAASHDPQGPADAATDVVVPENSSDLALLLRRRVLYGPLPDPIRFSTQYNPFADPTFERYDHEVAEMIGISLPGSRGPQEKRRIALHIILNGVFQDNPYPRPGPRYQPSTMNELAWHPRAVTPQEPVQPSQTAGQEQSLGQQLDQPERELNQEPQPQPQTEPFEPQNEAANPTTTTIIGTTPTSQPQSEPQTTTQQTATDISSTATDPVFPLFATTNNMEFFVDDMYPSLPSLEPNDSDSLLALTPADNDEDADTGSLF